MKGAYSVLEYHERSLPKMVVDLFPEIGASESGFKGMRVEGRGGEGERAEKREGRGGSYGVSGRDEMARMKREA